MNKAQIIIKRFSGQTALAKLLGKSQGTVQHWSKTGRIPAKWQPILLKLAREKSINVTSGDFIDDVVKEESSESSIPIARWPGVLPIFDNEIQVYVLDDERRVISRSAVISHLTQTKEYSGNLEKFVGIKALTPYLSPDFSSQLIEFILPGVVNKTVKGIQAETFLEICGAFVMARDATGVSLTANQLEIAKRANAFLSAVAKIGLLALIDEVTGFQYERAQDALASKLKLFLEDEMRQWEKTFPDELWKEFGRLTNWQGGIHSRPKYWGRLVMELVYENLDHDIAAWLKENAPKPMKGQNYHQWLSNQYGLKKLTEHIWMVIGMAKACRSMPELRQKVAEHFGKKVIQLTLYLPGQTGH